MKAFSTKVKLYFSKFLNTGPLLSLAWMIRGLYTKRYVSQRYRIGQNLPVVRLLPSM